jgi:hypothetical protein
MTDELRRTWVAVQKAETMLVTAGVRLRPKDAPDLREGLEMDRALRPLFSRAVYGFNPRVIRAADYLVRYPFSTADAIERQLHALVDAGVFTGPHGDAYAVTDKAEAHLKRHTERVGESIERLDLGDVGEEQIQKLLAYDHRILSRIRESVEHAPSPIFEHRLKGLRLEYDPPKRWHHWQLAWTMIAAHEDAEQQIRVDRGIEPLVWFARHELWFTARRPHRARMCSCADLARVAERYAPLEDAERDCRTAIEAMRQRGWVEGEGDACRLTEQELENADRDEAEIEEIFLARWPDFTDAEIAEMREIASAINRRCEELLAQEQDSSAG